MKQPKVLIGCPTCKAYGYTLASYLKAVSQIDWENKELLLVDNSEDDEYYERLRKIGVNVIRAPHYKDNVNKMLVESRNIIRDYALKNGFDYLLSLEQDIIAPKDVIRRLIAHKKDAASALYTITFRLDVKDEKGKEIKGIAHLPVAYFVDGPEQLRRAIDDEIRGKGLVHVGATGLGCMLISRKALSDIEFRYLEGRSAFDDIFFCHDLREKGYGVYIDSTLEVEHRHS